MVSKHSSRMSKIGSKNTTPERIVRSLVHRMGYRFRLHVSKLPGAPDMVFKSKRKIILIHGCFWHRHNCNKGRSKPKSNVAFWEKKFSYNIERDKKNIEKLKKEKWKVKLIWECQIKDKNKIKDTLMGFLS